MTDDSASNESTNDSVADSKDKDSSEEDDDQANICCVFAMIDLNYNEDDNRFDPEAEVERNYVQECLCLLSDVDFVNAIEKGGIKECGIDQRHIKIENIIYGPAKAAIEEKTVQRGKTRCLATALCY